MRPVIVSEKHMLQTSLFTVAAGARSGTDVIRAVAVANKTAATPFEVEEGSIVKAVYIEMWLNTNDTTPGSNIVTLEKLPAGATPITFGQMVALNTYPNKKNILFTSMGLTNPNSSTAIPVLRQWIKIPKR